MSEANVMTSNFPKKNILISSRNNSSFHSSASPRRSNRQNNVKVISKRLSEAKECRNCVRVRNWFRLLFAPENSKVLLNPGPPSPRLAHPMPPASIKRPPQSSRLRPSNPPKYAAVYFGGFSSI